MKRSAFFGYLLGMFGVAKAQQWKECVPDQRTGIDLGAGSKLMVCSSQMKPELNGQCPVCGTMAEPIKWHLASYSNKACDPPRTDGLACVEPNYLDPGPQIRRCKRCNAAFWQDAEK